MISSELHACRLGGDALEPASFDASLNLALQLRNSGNLDEAIHLIVDALRAHPDSPHADLAYFDLGTFYEIKQEWDLAGAQYERALQINPDMQPASQRLALLATQHPPAAR